MTPDILRGVVGLRAEIRDILTERAYDAMYDEPCMVLDIGSPYALCEVVDELMAIALKYGAEEW